MVISYGSRETSWVLQVEETVRKAAILFYEKYAQLKLLTREQAEEAVPIYSAYLELVDGKLIQDGIHALQNKGVTHIHVMPLFVSYGSTHVEEIKQAFGLEPLDDFKGDLEKFDCRAKVYFDEPIAEDEEVIQILMRQLAFINHSKEDEAVLLLGHGSSLPSYYTRWEKGMLAIANKLAKQCGYGTVRYASLLPDRSRETLQELLGAYKRVWIIPLFISPGYFTHKVIPMRLKDLSFEYTGETLLPSEEMVDLLARRFLMSEKYV